jgi:rhomboid protease GluP
MLRKLIREFQSYPATMGICLLWVLVYALMTVVSVAQGQPLSARALLLGSGSGHRFGSMTLIELSQGEVWRTLTSTFVHYGILHLSMNLFGMYQLGCLVESWYGRGQFLAIYVLIGAGGNLLSGVFRTLFGSNPYIHSGGGSTVVLGLVALCAVVGWRAKTRVGDYLRSQMVKVLVLTALLGLLPIIDNWGHAGGATVGALIGFAHRFLHRNLGRPSARWAGAIAILVLAASGAAQFLDDRAEVPERARTRLAARQQTLANLALVEREYRTAVVTLKTLRGGFMPKESLTALSRADELLEKIQPALDYGATRTDYRRLRALLLAVYESPPTLRDFQDFEATAGRLARRAIRDRDDALRDYLTSVATKQVKRTN